jgi:hypothetical protein
VYVSVRCSTLQVVRVTGYCSGTYSTQVTRDVPHGAAAAPHGLQQSAVARPAAAATTPATNTLHTRRSNMVKDPPGKEAPPPRFLPPGESAVMGITN